MLLTLRKAGFNRISFGIQSAVSQELLKLGRKHTAEQAAQAVAWAQAAGFDNISADMMLGIPGKRRNQRCNLLLSFLRWV